MLVNKIDNATTSTSFEEKLVAYFKLTKFRLSALVAFSAGMGYLLAAKTDIDWNHFSLFALGGFLCTASANIINQIKEVGYDALMKRTMNRPLPTGKLTTTNAWIYSMILGVLGFTILFNFINPFCAFLSLLSIVLYAFVYTPLKRVGPIAVLVGAVPGALPTLIGWVAMTNEIGFTALLLFGLQFIWQFPHFWAIAWLGDEDYKRAGFRLLPGSGEKNLNTAFTIMIYTLFLIPLGLLPAYFGVTGKVSAVIVTVMGTLFLMQTFYLMKTCSRKAALGMLIGSITYLPIVQVAFVFDKL